MEHFARLLDALTFTRSRNAKLRLIADYLCATPDPDRGWALAALTGTLDLKAVQPALLKALMAERLDATLFALSHDFVGDMAETISLLWPDAPGETPAPPALDEVVRQLSGLSRKDAPAVVAALLDRLDAPARYALIKLATGALRAGVSARLAKTGFAQGFGLDVEAVEEVWHGLSPPFEPLFQWAGGAAPQPTAGDVPVFRPFMLAGPLEDGATLDLADHAAEWKWDGIRVQLVHAGGQTRLFSRTGDDISGSFPDLMLDLPATLDGELLVRGEGQGAAGGVDASGSFNALQQRLGRKAPAPKLLAERPAFIRVYDLLSHAGEDLRPLPWAARRDRLEALLPALDPARFELSPLVEATSWDELAALRAQARDAAIEGLMLKRRDAPYMAGRKVGLWFKWKRDPLTADCVLMYAQRGHGRRSSLYSDFTFGCWSEDGQLLPVGKAYSGFTDAELAMLDKFVRAQTVQKFGPVREVEKSLVLEVAFDSIHASTRHKSGLAMRFPRIVRIRFDKPALEADTLVALLKLAT
ncbi:MAG: cisplatin damage response ATP-dependent DNA ligase [Sandarakinorhabdus sp.]|jgi:DNA ligase-1|nr:cisplatin damage response ATP-dependent DNA ligase [Sandarakinorhabdus sp.]